MNSINSYTINISFYHNIEFFNSTSKEPKKFHEKKNETPGDTKKNRTIALIFKAAIFQKYVKAVGICEKNV